MLCGGFTDEEAAEVLADHGLGEGFAVFDVTGDLVAGELAVAELTKLFDFQLLAGL